MADVRVLSTSMVQARNHKEQKRIELISCDLMSLVVGPIQKGLLFLKPNPSDAKNFVEHLMNSLSDTLDVFFPLAGRLAMVEHEDDDTISVFIECNNQGVQFVHAVADNVTVADILEPINVPPVVHSFFPLTGVMNYEGVSQPLLGVQVTELDDGVFIGCTMNHAVGDGTSFWNFFNSWSELARGLAHISKPPVIDRSFFKNVNSPRVPSSFRTKYNHEFTPPPLQERVFHFSKAQIAELKAKANAEAGEAQSISSFQSLLAHIWQSVIQNGGTPDHDGETTLRFSISIRPRFQPALPEQYFGNAFVIDGITLREKELLEHGHGYAALQMKKVIASYTEDKVRRWLEDWKMATMRGYATNGRFMVSSSPRYNVYGCDFGWGRPVAVRSGPANKFNGKITVFPGAEEGSIDIELCVSPEILEAMGNDL